MNKFLYCICIVFIYLSFSGCKKDKPKDIGVVINELMPVNRTVVADQNGEFDDWIELFNLNDLTVDLSGYFLTDSKTNLTKWKFPSGTVILPDSFLIVWADNDSLQSGLHASFKLSSAGETVSFLSPELMLIDRVSYGPQLEQLSFARIPNGTGEFSWQTVPTFNSKNIQSQ
jgi:hypothetical protein